jgi:hypothetical protein
MLTCNLCNSLDGILVNTSWIWLKSFKGVCPTISSMHNILGLIWNVTCGYNIPWIDCHSSSCTLPYVYSDDGLIPLLLVVGPFPICLMSCRMYAKSSWILSLWCATWLKSSTRQSWTIWAIISPSSPMIVYSGSVLCAFDFLRVPPICVAGLLFPLVPVCWDLGGLLCSLSLFLLFLGWLCTLLPLLGPYLIWPFIYLCCLSLGCSWYLGHLDFQRLCSPCSASSSTILSDTSWVMDGILHSLGHSLMTMSMSPSMMQ